MLGTILGLAMKEFLIPGARKHTHVPSQVTTGASLFRSGTYRTWKDKVHGIGFPEKSAQDQKKRDHFIKRDCSCEGPGMCLPLDPAFPLPVPPMCWSRPGGAWGESVLRESQPGLTNLRNEGGSGGGGRVINR